MHTAYGVLACHVWSAVMCLSQLGGLDRARAVRFTSLTAVCRTLDC